jgi:DNA end-binding protein Ku
MPRSLWTGSLSFGLVNVPVRLVTAARDMDLHFRQLHEKDGAPIETRRWCSEEDIEVPWEEVAHAYELKKGHDVVVTDEELAAAEPRKTRTIDIEQFVDVADVDPIYFDHPYFLEPAAENEGATRAYQLLVGALGQTDRAALGRFVMRTKEYLALIRVRDGVLSLTTMRFHDEVRPTKDVDTASAKKRKPTPQQLEQALALIDALSADWEPDKHEDRYRKRLQAVVRRKRKGQTIEVEDAEKEPAPAPDLIAALERSLAEIRGEPLPDEDEDGEDQGDAEGDGRKTKPKAKPKKRARAKAR